jgi:magnesium transporter
MIKAIYAFNGDSAVETRIENIPAIIEKGPRLMWLDIAIERNELSNEEIALMTECLHFHELSVEDALFPQYHPKIEEFENYVFTAIHGVRMKARDLTDFENSIYELDVFVGKNFVVTVHAGEVAMIDSLFEKAKLKPQVELRSLENLLYNIFQKVVSSFELTMDNMGDKIDDIEDRILKDPTAELIGELFDLKKILLNLRKITEPQKNIYTYFTRETNGIISRKFTAYFRDIYYQFDGLSQSIANYNQIISSVLEIYVSGATLKLNEIIKFLTIIATVFLPGVLIASYYGMNVSFPERQVFGTEGVWYFVIALILSATAGIFWYMKKKKWF